MNKSIIVLLLFASSNTWAAANKWMDEQGKVHYSDQLPPTHAKAKTIITSPTVLTPIASSAVSGVAGTKTAEIDPSKTPAALKKAASEKATNEASAKEVKQANCLAAKQNLANLRDGMRISVIDPTTGERSILDDIQRQKSVETAQQQTSQFCQ